MRSRKKTLLIAILLGLVAAIISAVNAPKVTAACGETREKLEQMAFNNSSLSGVMIPVSEQEMDQAYIERYASVSDAQCVATAKSVAAALQALPHTPWAPKMAQAGAQAKDAMRECHDRRVNGDFKTHAESAECSSPKIVAAFTAIGYPYMDLVTLFTNRRLEMAKQIDTSLITADTEDAKDVARLALVIAEQESARMTAVEKK